MPESTGEQVESMKHPIGSSRIKAVGKSGRISMVPENQLWTLEEPHRSRIERGLTWAAATEPQETDIEGLLKGRAKQAMRTRGHRR